MRLEKTLPHLAWASVAIGAYLIGANKPAAADPESSPKVSRADRQGSHPPGATAPEHAGFSGGHPSAIPTTSSSTPTQHPRDLIIAARESLKEVMADDDPLAAFDALSPSERDALARGALLDELGGNREGSWAMSEKALLGFDPQAMTRLLEMRIALKQTAHPDPAFRPSAYERLKLSPALEEWVGEQAVETLATRPRRNAQNMASVFSAALAAGANFGDSPTREDIAQTMVEGVLGSGEFAGTTFKIGTPDREIQEALAHIDVNMNYVAD